MKPKNKSHYSNDPEVLKTLAEEFAMIGRDYRLDLKHGVITQFVLPRKKVKKKRDDEKNERNKRSEKFERRT